MNVDRVGHAMSNRRSGGMRSWLHLRRVSASRSLSLSTNSRRQLSVPCHGLNYPPNQYDWAVIPFPPKIAICNELNSRGRFWSSGTASGCRSMR
jgi:hypothetical protein